MITMTIYVSETDKLASFADDFFMENDAEKMKAFVESLGYSASIVKTDERFAERLKPFRRKSIRDIDWSDWRVYEQIYNLSMSGKTGEQICIALGSHGSGMAVTMKLGDIMVEFTKFRDAEGGQLNAEKIERFAKLLADKAKSSNRAIQNRIDRLGEFGCDAGLGEKYPECEKGYHEGCYTCPHNEKAGKVIRDETTIERFNQVLADDYETVEEG
ncbi:MAG: hypothetical protein MUP55_01735 [Candidatus Aenigmarchaeota archaeon]|nr:hypothetical protein [Candidatus Aenigmarchaeota archaeon]